MAQPMRREIDPRIAAGTGSMTDKEPDNDERQDHGGGRAEQIKRKWQRQVVALTETMRAGRDRGHAKPDKSGAECKQPLSSAQIHSHDSRSVQSSYPAMCSLVPGISRTRHGVCRSSWMERARPLNRLSDSEH